MFVLPWVLGALFIFMLVFLWANKKSARYKKDFYQAQTDFKRPTFQEEFSAELTVPVYRPAPPAEPELPVFYGVDRLVLMARNPFWLYAYWEITATKQEEFSSTYGPRAWESSHPVLRVYNIGDSEQGKYGFTSYIDIGINDEADNWHINVGEPDNSFFVDLGRLFEDGRFITLLRSNIVTTPRASLSDREDEEWMWIEGIYRSFRHQYGYGSPGFAEEMAQKAGAFPLGVSSPGQWQKER